MVMAVFWVLIVEGIIGAMGMFLAQSTSIGYRRQTDHRGCQSGSQLAAPGFQEHRLLRLLLAGSTVDHQEFCWQTDQWLNQPAVVQLVVPDHTYLDCLAADPAAGSDHSCPETDHIAGSDHSCLAGSDRSHLEIGRTVDPAAGSDHSCFVGSDHSCPETDHTAGSDRSHPGIDRNCSADSDHCHSGSAVTTDFVDCSRLDSVGGPEIAPGYPIDPGCPGFADNRSSSDDFLFFLVLQMHISLKMST